MANVRAILDKVLGTADSVGGKEFINLLERELGVDTVAELRAIPIDDQMRKHGASVLVRGNTAAYDWDPRHYKFNTAAVRPDDGGGVIAPVPDKAEGRWESQELAVPPAVMQHQNIDLIAANAAVARMVAPMTGKLKGVNSVLTAAPSTGDPTLTTALTGIGNLSGGVVTIAQSGSAAGDIDEATLTGTDNDNDVEKGEEITVTVGGAGDTGGTANLSAMFVPREVGRPRDIAAADFNAASWLNATTVMAAATDSSKGIVSIWFKKDAGDGSFLNILRSTSAHIDLSVDSANRLDFQFQTSAAGNVYRIYDIPGYEASAAWRHILLSWNLVATPEAWMWRDGARDLQDPLTLLPGAVDWTEVAFGIGATSSGSQKWNGCLAEVYINTAEYLDLSIEANARKFVTADGKPVDLGADGSTPTGNAPHVYLGEKPHPRDFHKNSGSGVDTVLTSGPLLKCSTLPSW